MKINGIKRLITLNTLFLAMAQMFAQGPNNTGTYYCNADGKQGKELKTALGEIINKHVTLNYNDLWEAFKSTDRRPDGKVWDMYSGITDYEFVSSGSSYGKEGDCYNREHSLPKSWFKEEYPMYTDLVHLIPTDGYVNGRRSNFPFGETNAPTYTSNGGFSKLGPSSVSGYGGTVFEPNDEYKGDFARIYFYMVTCYEDKVAGWNSDMLDHTGYPAFTQWAIDMLLRWAGEDPVSQKEIDRNNAIYDIQGNRNPYVDYPGLEQYVWGNSTAKPFSYDEYEEPEYIPDTPVTPDDPVIDSNTFRKVTSEDELTDGSVYIIVCEASGVAMGESTSKYRNGVNVTISDNTINTEINGAGQPRGFILGGNKGAYTLFDSTEKSYLALNGNDNSLNGKTAADTDNAQWTITVAGECLIANNAYNDRYINYNPSSPRFACYKTSSNQRPVALYKGTTPTGIANIATCGTRKVDVYGITGQKIRSKVNADKALHGLQKGIYIIEGKKYLVM